MHVFCIIVLIRISSSTCVSNSDSSIICSNACNICDTSSKRNKVLHLQPIFLTDVYTFLMANNDLCDFISINLYHVKLPTPARFTHYTSRPHGWIDKGMFIPEHSFRK